jgi:hypothetical protein
MRKVITFVVLAVLSFGTVGCAKKAATVAIPGQINTFDGYAYRSLMDAQAAIDSFKQSTNNGATFTASQKVDFNKIVQDYNVANALWQVYHAGSTGNQAALTAAITTLVSDISGIATQLGGK